jgi:hypothetical protein
MTFRACAIAVVICCCFSRCTPLRPRVSLAPGASLKGYTVFIVGPVTDETGARFNLDVADSLRQRLVSRLRSHGLAAATEAPAEAVEPAVVISSALVGFRGIPMWLQVPARGTTGCELRSVLRDSETGRRIGEIVAADLSEEYSPMVVLIQCAHDVADAIDRQVRRK